MLSNDDVTVSEAMRRFGTQLGIAFQIQDDLLDITGDENIVGKSLGKDLDAGKLTLPLIRCLAVADESQRADVLALIAKRDADQLRRRLISCGSVEKTREQATQLVEDAKTELGLLDQGPARELLRSLADAVISRQF
jgi:octaprenyl-diphosphate synthase